MHNLDILFNPNTVVIVGASSDNEKWGHWLCEQTITHKDLRSIYFVNPKEKIILGKKSIKSIDEISESIDVAVVAVSSSKFEKIVNELIDRRVKFIIAITAGLAETGKIGDDIERRILNKLQGSSSRLLGPNCAGVWDSFSPFHCLPFRQFDSGCVGLISQSGGIIIDVFLRLQEVRLGFSRITSIGNQLDISIVELIESYEQDPNTKVIALYIENTKDIPYHIFDKISKPIIFLTPSFSESTVRAALQHSNSTLSIINEKIKSNKIFHALTIREFVAFIQAALLNIRTNSNRIVIITDTGGIAVMLCSSANNSGLILNTLSDKLCHSIDEKIRPLLPNLVIGNPIDLVGIKGGFTTPTITLLNELLNSAEVDGIILILHLIETCDENPDADRECGDRLSSIIKSNNKPTMFVCKNFNTPGVISLLENHIPVYQDVETAVKAMRTLCGL